MPGQTKLYQRAGSPLIMGHSRYERSAWTDWVLAGLVSSLGVLAVHALSTLLDPARPYLGTPADFANWLLLASPGIVTAIVVSGALVWFGHRAGWRRAWAVSGLVGAAAGLVVTVLGWRLL